ncbi:MAG: sigma-70 family RNA polymerase sigma factor [Verrucomicrobia bacterium]|nr:sigma-70 family RNA polymerase sigma factor [Verrucomicrobiota bacterium]
MPSSDAESKASGVARPEFVTTHWSVVLAAADGSSPVASAALEELCRTYWFPLYAFVRRQGYNTEEAQDLTQEFFCRFFEKNYLAQVRQEKGKFRSFLLAAMKHFLANERVRANRLKRGGGQTIVSLDTAQGEQRYLLDPETDLSPEKIFEQRWATTIMEKALARLREESGQAGKAQQFELLKKFLSTEPGEGEYAAIGKQLETNPRTIGVAVFRLRQRYRELVRAEVAKTVAHPSEVDEELRHLCAVLAG